MSGDEDGNALIRHGVNEFPKLSAAEGIDSYAEYLPPTAGYAEQAYFFDLRTDRAGTTAAMLRNATGDRGFSLRWNKAQLPCFTQWKCTQPEPDGYVTGLEPGDGPGPHCSGRSRSPFSVPPRE